MVDVHVSQPLLSLLWVGAAAVSALLAPAAQLLCWLPQVMRRTECQSVT
jgi:hypothetical protein